VTSSRQSLAVGALVVAACAAPAGGAPSPVPPTAPVVAPAPVPSVADAPERAVDAQSGEPSPVDAGDAEDASEAEAPEADSGAALAPALLRIEHPYVSWDRKRPKGEVAAAADDELIGRWNLGGTQAPTYASNRPGFHPGTRVVVDTRVVSGRLVKRAPLDRRTGKHHVVLSETSLLVRSRKHGYWPFRLCFEDAAREKGRVKGGKTTLRFDVDARGRVKSARVVDTKLDEPSIADCLRDRAKEIELLPPPRRIGVELTVQLWPGDVRVPLLPKAPTPEPPGLDADAVESVVTARQSELQTCYAAGLARDASLWGRLQLHVTVDGKGRVLTARESESQFPDPEVVTCISRLVRGLGFSKGKSALPEFELGFRMGRLPEAP
jgi:hypothetical protein